MDRVSPVGGALGLPSAARAVLSLLYKLSGLSACHHQNEVENTSDITAPGSQVSDEFDAQPKERRKTAAGRKPLILVVDDEKTTTRLMAELLSEGGFNVATAVSGFECLDKFRQQPWAFDLVLLDLNMPFLDGEEVFERLKEIRPDVAVLLCTGLAQRERVERLLSEGFLGLLRKPFDPATVVRVVRATLQSAKYGRGTLSS